MAMRSLLVGFWFLVLTTAAAESAPAIQCTVVDVAGNVSGETITVTVKNLKKRLRPRRLNLNSSGGHPIQLRLTGPSVDVLAPVDSHGFQLSLAGEFTIHAIPGGSTVPDGNKLTVLFDRVEFISAIEAFFDTLANPPKRLELRVFADGQDMGGARLRVKQ